MLIARVKVGNIKFCGVELDALTGARVGSGHGVHESLGEPGVSSAAQGSAAGHQLDGLAPRPRVTPQNLMLPRLEDDTEAEALRRVVELVLAGTREGIGNECG